MALVKEETFSVNNFMEPKIKYGPEAVCLLLVRLLLMDPGQSQSHPDMGIGIATKYRYAMYGEVGTLKSDIVRQINLYAPELSDAEVNVEEVDMAYYITVTIDGMLYGLTIDESGKTKTVYQSLNEMSEQINLI